MIFRCLVKAKTEGLTSRTLSYMTLQKSASGSRPLSTAFLFPELGLAPPAWHVPGGSGRSALGWAPHVSFLYP